MNIILQQTLTDNTQLANYYSKYVDLVSFSLVSLLFQVCCPIHSIGHYIVSIQLVSKLQKSTRGCLNGCFNSGEKKFLACTSMFAAIMKVFSQQKNRSFGVVVWRASMM